MKILAISSGNGNLATLASLAGIPCSGSASCALQPYNISSNSANLAASTLVESITRDAVGFRFGTSTGVVDNSQENVIASGLSFTVA